MRMYKVCPDYMSSGLMHNRYLNETKFYYMDEDKIEEVLSPDTYKMLCLCQQIFDQTDSWSSKDADYKFPHFITRKQYEILCWVVAKRVESETGVPTIAQFYWDTNNV